MSSDVGIHEFENDANRFIDRVESGEDLTIIRRGKAVARVIPVDMPLAIARPNADAEAPWSGRRTEALG